MPTIAKESITSIPPCGEFPIVRYEWLCPQCNTKTHGDAKKDTVFEIWHDPLCIYCRVKNGEFVLKGSNFVRVAPPGQTRFNL